jgi:hypothetical protein
VPLEAGPDWNITPDPMQPVIRLGRDTGKRELALLKWRASAFLFQDFEMGRTLAAFVPKLLPRKTTI